MASVRGRDQDPGEKQNLAASASADLAEGRRLLGGFEMEGRKARQLLRLSEGETTQLDAHTLERLRSLGYAR